MVGRTVFVCRYGGEKISTRISKPSTGLPPNVATRPSGSNSADEWYTRGTVGLSTLVHVEVLGLKIWLLYTALLPFLIVDDAPPVSNTVESGRITALTYIFFVSIAGPGTYV